LINNLDIFWENFLAKNDEIFVDICHIDTFFYVCGCRKMPNNAEYSRAFYSLEMEFKDPEITNSVNK
jgi:hypothetical protein